MPSLADSIRAILHPVNPYRDFPYQDYPVTLQGIGDVAIMRQILESTKPRLIIEVGSWKGDSAVEMASYLKKNKIDGTVICVDTWLGGIEHINSDHQRWGLKQFNLHGYSTLYYHFLANVMHKELEDLIIPLANTSQTGARYLKKQKIAADLIYIDGSHEDEDVYADLKSYWPVLKNGGIMFGDDWHATWYGVICAVSRFAKENNLELQIAGENWILQKPV